MGPRPQLAALFNAVVLRGSNGQVTNPHQRWATLIVQVCPSACPQLIPCLGHQMAPRFHRSPRIVPSGRGGLPPCHCPSSPRSVSPSVDGIPSPQMLSVGGLRTLRMFGQRSCFRPCPSEIWGSEIWGWSCPPPPPHLHRAR